MSSVSKISNSINVSYITGTILKDNSTVNVRFKISFGKGKDSSVYKNESDLKQFTKSYEVETLESEDTECYYVIAEEGPIVIKIEDPDIFSNYNDKYVYALGFAVDFEEPEYSDDSHMTPSNIERDGVMWSIPIEKPWKPSNKNVFYQNGKAKYQWTTSRAKVMGEELTEDEKLLGIEKTSESTGMMYITIMVLRKEKEVAPVQKTYRGSNTRCSGASRGIRSNSVAGRVGYGNSATTSSVASTFKYAEDTDRYVIPVRIRISNDSEVSDVNCSKTLRGAEVNTERKKMVTAPFYP